MTIHTPDSLGALDATMLRDLYTSITGSRPGRRSRDTMIATILETPAPGADTSAPPTESGDDPSRTEDGPQGPTEPLDAAENGTSADVEGPEEVGAPEEEAQDGFGTGEGTEPSRVRLVGYGAYEGNEMTCHLVGRTPVTAVVQVVNSRIRFGLEDGRISHRRKGWDESGWRLDLTSLPAHQGFTDEEVDAMPLRDLSVDQLRALYERTLGRTTGSTDRTYLTWKIREARKGRVPVGPADRRTAPGVEVKVLSVRLERAAVEALDAAWARHGFHNRLGFLRVALARLLREHGEDEAAVMFE